MTFRGAGRLGLMGGTFNPVHLGHLRAAEEIAEHLGLDRVVFMPAAFPPHKPGLNLAGFADRLEMLRLATRGRDLFAVSDLELGLPPPSYTSNTLREVGRLTDPGCELFFLVGFDSFRTVGRWRGGPELFGLASFVVFRRPGRSSGLASVAGVLKKFLPGPGETRPGPDGCGTLAWPGLLPVRYYGGCRLEISSTDLRDRLAGDKSVRYLVPDSVRDYLDEKSLYRDPGGRRGPPGPGR
ncbi:MAG: nicotinate-nucleotide adenylyltransferase [Deltaproteobacteria bacterium]|jgi:nicotinate-nucleotide adenylyltransferase|nr:nicotinate-nucleotide adenylyltransferase [Deltaproteobacteria bacterium]